MSNILVVRSDFETATSHGSFWMANLINQLKTHNVTDLHAAAATAANVKAQSLNNDIIVILGHGCYFLQTVQNFEKAFYTIGACGGNTLSDKAVNEIKGKKVYFLSCQCGKNLLPDAITNGTQMAAGFMEDFVFVVDGNPPNQDIHSQAFGNAFSVSAASMANGGSVQKIFSDTQQAFGAEANKWKIGNDVLKDEMAKWLTYDASIFTIQTRNEILAGRPLYYEAGVGNIFLYALLAIPAYLIIYELFLKKKRKRY